jgi:MoaA/NifB/PqqE/SkfB family radical SAM enzyme
MRISKQIQSTISLAQCIFAKKFAWDAIPIIATNRCNSKCTICNIWQKTPKTDLDPAVVEKVLSDKCINKRSRFVITGGEFLLHPKHEEILSILNAHKAKYLLLSNGLMSKALIEIVRKFQIKQLSMSLDGPPETYKRVRGVDGYSKVEEVVTALKNENVTLNIGYTISPLNNRSDLLQVIDFCNQHKVNLSVGYYCGMEYYDAKQNSLSLYNVDDLFNETYYKFYPIWAAHNYDMPCLSIFMKPVIRPNGDVELCEPREIRIGNLYEDSLSEIWKRKSTRASQIANFNCRLCWHDSERQCDFATISHLTRIFPPFVLDHFFGSKEWRKMRQLSNQQKSLHSEKNQPKPGM